jgi:type VI secretion system secreted protein VgrG
MYTDEYGRVKVQFHWDREGKKDENSSCWIRVSQIHAGKGFGAMSIPRIDEEVIVSFLEGDPDRPIITGRVYHAKNMPPYGLPDSMVISGVKSNSTKGGGGYNEMVMDDTKGKEMLRTHAQYDMSTTVEHDDTQTVHNNRTITVDGTHTETIDKDTTILIKTGNLSHDVKTGTALYHVQGAVQEKFDDSQDTIVKNGIHIASEAAHIYIHTATSIQLHVGESNIWMDSGGQISIKGNNIAIDGKESVTIHGGMVRSVAETTHETEGANVKSEGKATNTVKGGMVMLNP